MTVPPALSRPGPPPLSTGPDLSVAGADLPVSGPDLPVSGAEGAPTGLPAAGAEILLPTVDDTHEFGRRLASVLRAGDLVLLSGPLGAGKTALAQGIGAGLAVLGQVASPTFVIARVHRPDPSRGGRVSMVHVDAYRLGATADPRAEVDDLDLDASLEDSVTVVEWGEGMVEQLADTHLRVRVDRRDDDTRVVVLEPHGGDWAGRLR